MCIEGDFRGDGMGMAAVAERGGIEMGRSTFSIAG